MPRRSPGTLIDLEVRILETCVDLLGSETPIYGFSLARALAETSETRGLTAHGTLYKALGRLAEHGFVEAAWEDAELAAAENRPRRKLYRVTGEGRAAATAQRARLTSAAAATRAGSAGIRQVTS